MVSSKGYHCANLRPRQCADFEDFNRLADVLIDCVSELVLQQQDGVVRFCLGSNHEDGMADADKQEAWGGKDPGTSFVAYDPNHRFGPRMCPTHPLWHGGQAKQGDCGFGVYDPDRDRWVTIALDYDPNAYFQVVTTGADMSAGGSVSGTVNSYWQGRSPGASITVEDGVGDSLSELQSGQQLITIWDNDNDCSEPNPASPDDPGGRYIGVGVPQSLTTKPLSTVCTTAVMACENPAAFGTATIQQQFGNGKDNTNTGVGAVNAYTHDSDEGSQDSPLTEADSGDCGIAYWQSDTQYRFLVTEQNAWVPGVVELWSNSIFQSGSDPYLNACDFSTVITGKVLWTRERYNGHAPKFYDNISDQVTNAGNDTVILMAKGLYQCTVWWSFKMGEEFANRSQDLISESVSDDPGLHPHDQWDFQHMVIQPEMTTNGVGTFEGVDTRNPVFWTKPDNPVISAKNSFCIRNPNYADLRIGNTVIVNKGGLPESSTGTPITACFIEAYMIIEYIGCSEKVTIN